MALLLEHLGAQVFAVHVGNDTHRDFLRADGFAFVLVGAVTEAFFVHGTHQVAGAAVALDGVAYVIGGTHGCGGDRLSEEVVTLSF